MNDSWRFMTSLNQLHFAWHHDSPNESSGTKLGTSFWWPIWLQHLHLPLRCRRYYSFFVRHLPRSTRCGAATWKNPLKHFLVSRGVNSYIALLWLYHDLYVIPCFTIFSHVFTRICSCPTSHPFCNIKDKITLLGPTFNPSSLAQQTCLVASPAILSFSCYCFMQQPR